MTPPSDSSTVTPASATPAMRQYLAAKRDNPDTIVFFRMGDFYEMFYEDALTAARVLELTLTSRSKDSGGSPIPMCGVPHHAAESYLTRLVKRGFRVALCEQVEDPRHAKSKKLLRREVVRVVSPGTLTSAGYLDAKEPTLLMALIQNDDAYGAAIIDVSTGDFHTAEFLGPEGAQALADELTLLSPREIVVANDSAPKDVLAAENAPATVTPIDSWTFGFDHATRVLCDQFRTTSLDGYGLDNRPLATMAAGALLQYVRDTQKVALDHVRTIAYRSQADHLLIDPQTFSHLEIVDGAAGDPRASLLSEIDRTATSMGGRRLRDWLQHPLHSLERILDRLDAVEELEFRSTERAKLHDALKNLQDLERLVARVALRRAGARELVGLGLSLAIVPRVRDLIKEFEAPLARSLAAELDDIPEVRNEIHRCLVDEPPATMRDGGYIRDGCDTVIDELRSISRNAKQHIAAMEQVERDRTGITSLKIRYNRVFGYYIEVSKSNLHAVPSDYLRKQTLVNGERFITPTLKEYEENALGADEKLLDRETEIFDSLRDTVADESPRIQSTARALANLDVLASFADASGTFNFTKPQMHEGDELTIVDGRHPIVERHCADSFVPNDTVLNSSSHQVVILTGPNMGGKSTYLRQVALITLLAHAGSFVPAARAKIPIVDRIFARVGASDNIARGQSTFMLEMQETAKILHLATSKSLVILDEIGRGTATFDGLSIAWAVAESLATSPDARPKTLFATHYHELTDLAESTSGVKNYHVLAREWKDDIVFLRKVEPGRSDRSYGIQVARLAGLPPQTVHRAKDILQSLENDELSRAGRPSFSASLKSPTENDLRQLGLFRRAQAVQTKLGERLRSVDLDRLTPLDALTLLAELKKELDLTES